MEDKVNNMKSLNQRLIDEQKEKLKSYPEIQSRLPYVTDPTAKKLWEFLSNECLYNLADTPFIPADVVLDALIMINQDKIEYSTI